MSIYTDNGYTDRNDYLECMSQDYGVSKEFVYAMADLLGPCEDFDGLVNILQDAEGLYD